MTLLDANILIYAYDLRAPQHPPVMHWFTQLLQSGETIALPWVSVWAFLRISTNPRLWQRPRPVKEAFGILREWLTQPGIVFINPGPRHAEVLEALVMEHSITGSLLTDAALAAMAIESGAVLASTDQDFSRFRGLKWVNPLK